MWSAVLIKSIHSLNPPSYIQFAIAMEHLGAQSSPSLATLVAG